VTFTREIEVMAPAGSYESLQAAIQGGANAVYFGVGKLNMRSRSSHNFTKDDLQEICRIANEANLKTYLTLNTVLYDQDLGEMEQVVLAAKEAGINAIIASDPAVLDFAANQGVPLHISTQANISNLASVKFYSRFADVMVLARELSLEQVSAINAGIKAQKITGPSGKQVQTELFVHGALCMAISGKCYLSLHELNASANRGECLQMCRRSFLVTEKESGAELEVDNEYIMSPKDLLTIDFLDKILAAGVDVLKIEGRARSPEYVKTVSACYREAVNAIAQGEYTQARVEQWKSRLQSVFNRGFWDGYYLGRRLGEWSEKYGSKATTRKVYLGKVTNYFSKLGVAEFLIETKSLRLDDSIMVIGRTTGVLEQKVEEIRFDDKPVKLAKKGQSISIPTGSLVRRNDKLYKIVEVTLKDQFNLNQV